MEQIGYIYIIWRFTFNELSQERFKYRQNKGPAEGLHYAYEFWMEWKKS